MTVPLLALNDGHTIPQLGFGVYRVDPRQTEQIVTDALGVGYRHIDTAEVYGNEAGVGRAIASSGIPREELFVTTKVWPGQRSGNPAASEFPRSLERLGLDYVDLYLIHWPLMPTPMLHAMWGSFEQFQSQGQVRSIGVSNFTAKFLGPMLGWAQVTPAVNQLELHPAYQQREAVALGREHAIVPEAWGPLGQGRVDYEHSVVGQVAQRLGVTWAQVLLRWHIQQGHVVIPKSNHRARMQENFDIFGFELTPEEEAAITALNDPNFPAINPDYQ